MAEHLTRNEKVVGSIPTISSSPPQVIWPAAGFYPNAPFASSLFCVSDIFRFFCKMVLTPGRSCGIILLALNVPAQREHDARVVELVDSLASGASARKGVRVRLPPRAPKKEEHLLGRCSSFFVL